MSWRGIASAWLASVAPRVTMTMLALTTLAALIAVSPVQAEPTADALLDARVQHIATELRCLVCQNQTIADSHAQLAIDLRHQVRKLLLQGASDAEVYAYMTERYGDFVLYRPPLKAATAMLWFGPALLLLGGAVALGRVLLRRSRLPADDFEASLPA